MKTKLLLTIMAICLLLMPFVNLAQAPNLGTTASYAFFTAAGAFSNTSASTVVTGNVGTNVGAFTAFPPGTLIGQKHVADPATAQAAIDVANAYASLSAVNCGQVLTTTLGNGQVLTPNVYCLGAASTLNGNLTLDGGGDPNALFIFKINGALATNTLSTITLTGSASLCNVYWQVNGEVDLGDGSVFQGTIVADGAIHLLGNATLFGRGLTTAGAISLQDNVATVPAQPVASTITASGATTFCQGGSVTLSGNVGGIWSNGATTPTITTDTSGDFFVTNSNCGNVVSNHIIVTVNPLPDANAGADATICSGNSVTLGAAPISGHTYLWTPSTGLSSSTIANPVASPTATTTYTLTETITATGCQKSNSVTVTVNPLPVTPVITASGPTSFCGGGSVTLSGNTAGGTWSTGATTSSITVTAAGSYSVTNTNACGSATSNIIVVAVNQPPVPPVITANGPVTFCSGGSVTLSGNTAGGTWSTGATTPSITVTAAGTYSVTITNACGSATSNVIVVTVSPLPATPVITASGPTSFCTGGSVTLSGNTGGGTWSNGATTSSITVTTGGSYSVTNTNACGSATSNVIVVTVNQPPVPPVITANGPVTFCSGGSVTLSGNTAGGTWSTGATTASITVSAAGNYSVTITNACGSATSNVIVVTVSPLPVTPVITASGPTSLCGGASVILSGNTGGGTWSTGATSTSITVTAAGSYSVTNTNACGSATSNIIVVSVNQPPVPPVITANGPITFCSGGSVTLSGNTAGGTWSTGATTPSITVHTAGSYSVTITNTCGSATSNVIVVTINQLPVAPVITAGGSTSLCNGGSVILSGNTGGGTWSTGATTPSITVTAAGSYSVTVTNACGSATSNIIVVSVNQPPALPVITANGPLTFCSGGSVILSGNTAGGTWSTGAKTPSITVTAAGTYTLTITSACGNASSSVIVTVNPLPTATTGNSVTICKGKSVTIGGQSIPGHTYSWTPATGLSSSTISNPVAGPTVTTTYTLTETITATGCQKSNRVTITVSPAPVSTITGGTSICQGTPITLCAPAGCITYLWSTGAKTSCITVSTAGTYTVTVSNAAGCSSTSSITITAGTPPAATTGSNITICKGKSVTLGAASIPGHTYSWTPATGLSSSTISNPVASPTVTTTYTLTETITATGCQKSNSVTITVSPAPVSTITGGTGICQGTPVTLCAPAGCITYLWSTGAKTSCITVSTAGTYTVTVSNAAGCTSTSSVTITAGTPPAATTGSKVTICKGKSVTLGAASIPGHTYSWTPATGLSSSTISNPVASPTVTTTYTLTETITATGCQKSNSVTITVSPAPVSTITGGTGICQGTPVTLCAPAGCITYLWSTGAKTSCITVSTAGTYTVTVTNAAGCSSTSSTTITAGTPPAATTGSNTTICSGKSVTLGGTSISGHTYSWTPTTGLSSSTISKPVASPTVTTTYTLTETITATGCKKSNNVTITVSAPPSCLISGNTSICQGQTTQLCAPAGCSTYLWSTGAKTSCITVSSAGTYSVTVSNAGGCTSTCSKTVSITQPPVCTISGSSNCTKNQPTQLCAPAGCTSYSWSTGAKTSCITVSTAGKYSCTVSNAGGCTTSGSKTVTNNTVAAVIIGTPDSDGVKTATVDNEDQLEEPAMQLEVFPNPTQNFFTLIVHSKSKLEAEVMVFDVLGHAVAHLHGSSGEQIRFGSQFVQGMYFVQVLQGNIRKVVKVIKI